MTVDELIRNFFTGTVTDDIATDMSRRTSTTWVTRATDPAIYINQRYANTLYMIDSAARRYYVADRVGDEVVVNLAFLLAVRRVIAALGVPLKLRASGKDYVWIIGPLGREKVSLYAELPLAYLLNAGCNPMENK